MASGDSYFGHDSNVWQGLTNTYTIENQGLSGATLDYLIWANKETRLFNNVIIFAGYNNIKTAESVEDIITKYTAYYNQLSGTNKYCISVPPLNHTLLATYFPSDVGVLNTKIQAVNAGILALCGSDKYIDCYSQFVDGSNECLTDYTDDGLHPNTTAYVWIVQNLISKL